MSRLSLEEEESVRLKLREQQAALDSLQDLRLAAEDHLNNKFLEIDNIIEKLLKSLIRKGDEIKSELDESMAPLLDAITIEVRQRNRIVSSLKLNGSLPITSTRQVSCTQNGELPVLATIDPLALNSIEQAVEGLRLGATGLSDSDNDQGEARENFPPTTIDNHYQQDGVGRGCKKVVRASLQPAVGTCARPPPPSQLQRNVNGGAPSSPNHGHLNSPRPQGLLISAYKQEPDRPNQMVVKCDASVGSLSRWIKTEWDHTMVSKMVVGELYKKTLDFNRFLAQMANEEVGKGGLVDMWGDITCAQLTNIVVTEDGCLYSMNSENGEISCYSSQTGGRLMQTDSFLLTTSFDRDRDQIRFSMTRDGTHVFTVALSAATCRLEVTKLPLDEIRNLFSTTSSNRKLIQWSCDEEPSLGGRNFQLKVENDQICVLQEHAEEDLLLLVLNQADLSPSHSRVFRTGKYSSLSLARNVFMMHGKVFFIEDHLNSQSQLVMCICEFVGELEHTSQLDGSGKTCETHLPLKFRGCSVCGDFLLIHMTVLNEDSSKNEQIIRFYHFGFAPGPGGRRFYSMKQDVGCHYRSGSSDYAMMAASSYSSNHNYLICQNESLIKVSKFLPNFQ